MKSTSNPPPSALPQRRDYLYTVLGALGISTAPILFALSSTHPTTGGLWRFTYGLMLLIPVCLSRPAARSAFALPDWRSMAMVAGLFFAIDITLWHRSVALIGAGPGTLLANTQVIWVALIGLLFLNERPSRAFWLSLPVVVVGMWLLSGGDLEGFEKLRDRNGLLYGAGSGFAYALCLVALRQSMRRAPVPPEAVLTVQLLAGLAALGLIGGFEGSIELRLSLEQHAWLATLGVGVQGGAWFLITRGIRTIPGHHGSMLLLTQPVMSLLLGWWILGQAQSLLRVSGAVLLLLGIAVPLLRETRGSLVERH